MQAHVANRENVPSVNDHSRSAPVEPQQVFHGLRGGCGGRGDRSGGVEHEVEATPQGAALSSANYVTNFATRVLTASIGLTGTFNPLLHHHLPTHTSLPPILLPW